MVYAVLGVCCTRCMLYSVFAVLGVCSTRCMLYLVVRGSPLASDMILGVVPDAYANARYSSQISGMTFSGVSY
jgi:hypothetical protein